MVGQGKLKAFFVKNHSDGHNIKINNCFFNFDLYNARSNLSLQLANEIMLFSELVKIADQGDPSAQYEVAQAYWLGYYSEPWGIGKTKDTEDAPPTIVVNVLKETVEKNIAKTLEYLVKSMLNEYIQAYQMLIIVLNYNPEASKILIDLIKKLEPKVGKKVLKKLDLEILVDLLIDDTKADASISEPKQELKEVPKSQSATSKKGIFGKTLKPSMSAPAPNPSTRPRLRINPPAFGSTRTL